VIGKAFPIVFLFTPEVFFFSEEKRVIIMTMKTLTLAIFCALPSTLFVDSSNYGLFLYLFFFFA